MPPQNEAPSESGVDLVADPPRPFLSNIVLADANSDITNFVMSMRLFEDDIREKGWSGEDVTREFNDRFPPGVLFGEQVQALTSIYSAIRDLLDKHGAQLVQHSSRRVAMTLATSAYTEAEDRNLAVEFVKEMQNRGRRRPFPQVEPPEDPARAQRQGGPPDSHFDRTAHNIAMRFKDPASKFRGDIGECWQEFVDEYRQVCRDYKLSNAQKLDYLHNLLFGDAKRFYLDRVYGYASGFQQAVDMVDAEYNSIVRQTRVKNFLSSVRMSKFESEGLDSPASLEKVYKIITKLARQLPRAYHGDTHRVEFLRKSVVGYDWATEPLSRIATNNLNFQQLYGELESALNLSREAKLAKVQDTITKKLNTAHEKELPGIFYDGQGRYLRQNKPARASYGGQGRLTTPQKGQAFDPLSLMGCFNCGGNHLISKCPEPLNAAQAARRKVEYYEKKREKGTAVHKVLFELCEQLDAFAETADSETTGAAGTFHQVEQEPSVPHQNHELFEEVLAELDEVKVDEPFEALFYQRD